MDSLMEDLTVQQVILESLQGQSWDGIEDERREINNEIDRLKRLLRQPRQVHSSADANGAFLYL